MIKIGLVLSGGGAKGAYQAGVVKALSELNVRIDAVSGASIGALNGSLVASAPTLAGAASRLERLWRSMGEESPLRANKKLVSMLLVYGVHLGLQLGTGGLASIPVVGAFAQTHLGHFLAGRVLNGEGLLDDSAIREIMDEALDMNALRQGIPLHVSVYKTQGLLVDLARFVGASLRVCDTAPSHFAHVQSLGDSEAREALLASASIPFLFSSKEFRGGSVDGGLGGFIDSQGNTPAQPLVDAGCNVLIVTHLSDGSFWDRRQFPTATCVEIRPGEESIGAGKGFLDMLDFSHGEIERRMKLGYEDTMRCLMPIRTYLGKQAEAQQSWDAIQRLLNEI